MIPDPITWGHVLMLAGLLAGLYALVQSLAYLRHRAHGRGTPGYARARDGRRFAVLALLAAAALYAICCLTPLAEVAIA